MADSWKDLQFSISPLPFYLESLNWDHPDVLVRGPWQEFQFQKELEILDALFDLSQHQSYLMAELPQRKSASDETNTLTVFLYLQIAFIYQWKWNGLLIWSILIR